MADGAPAAAAAQASAAAISSALAGTGEDGGGWFSIESIRAYNPNLDEEQAHRAFLPPGDYGQPAMDYIVDSMCAAAGTAKAKAAIAKAPKLHRTARKKLARHAVQLYTTDFSAGMLSRAAFAGFFVFGSEFQYPGQPLQARSLLNLELCGPNRETEGRVVLIGGRNLTVGKRSLEMLGVPSPVEWAARAAAAEPRPEGRAHIITRPNRPLDGSTVALGNLAPAAPAPTAAGPSMHGTKHACPKSYVFTVNRAFDQSWDAIVDQHGVDWCGFDAVRAGFRRLHEATSGTAETTGASRCPDPSGTMHDSPVHDSPMHDPSGTIQPGVRMISMELWDGPTGQLVSAEVGYIVGSAYCCLSLFARDAEYPKCSRTRTQCGILWLERAGVELFDAGTTASYYVHLHGFKRLTRTKFVEQWRRCRAKPLDSPSVLESPCTDVRGLINQHINQQASGESSGGAVRNPIRAAGKRKASELGETSAANRDVAGTVPPKGALSISLAGVGNWIDSAALQAHFGRHGPVRKVVKLGGNSTAAADIYGAVIIFADCGSAAAALAAAVGGTTVIKSPTGSECTLECTVSVTGGPSRKKQKKPNLSI